MFRYLRNWREVWAAYRTAQRLPPLQFRRGFVLNHGPADDPILLLHTVFARSEYGALAGRFRYLVDIGANIGTVTLDLAWRDPNLKVDAYEPNPLTFDTLSRNVRENGLDSRVRTYRDAVTNQDGEALLWSGDSSVLSSLAVRSCAKTRRRTNSGMVSKKAAGQTMAADAVRKPIGVSSVSTAKIHR